MFKETEKDPVCLLSFSTPLHFPPSPPKKIGKKIRKEKLKMFRPLFGGPNQVTRTRSLLDLYGKYIFIHATQ